jgi:predicted dehydrogenase
MRVGVVGAGFIGAIHLDAYAKMPEVEVVGVADALPEVAAALAAASAPELGERSTAGAQEADALKAEADALDELALRGYANEALDQLLVDVLLGIR